MDSFGVDAAVCGSQKGLMLPPGLSFIALSARAWEAVEQARSPRYYFDLRLYRDAWADFDTPFTPGISLIVGLTQALKQIQAEGGVDRIVARHKQQAQEIRRAVKGLGLELYTDPACTSNAVTAVKVPAGIDGKELLKRLRANGIILAGGQGKTLTGKIFRIASMGAIGLKEIQAGLVALEKVLAEMGWKVGVHG
jgi:aspartate aminotransferase-like enzyme